MAKNCLKWPLKWHFHSPYNRRNTVHTMVLQILGLKASFKLNLCCLYCYISAGKTAPQAIESILMEKGHAHLTVGHGKRAVVWNMFADRMIRFCHVHILRTNETARCKRSFICGTPRRRHALIY